MDLSSASRRTNDGQVGALEKVLAPVRHDGDETLGVHFHQCVAILRSCIDSFLPVLHLTDRSHAPLLRCRYVLAVIFFRQPLTRKAAAGHAPQQETANGLGMPQGKKQRGPATGGAAADKSGKGASCESNS